MIATFSEPNWPPAWKPVDDFRLFFLSDVVRHPAKGVVRVLFDDFARRLGSPCAEYCFDDVGQLLGRQRSAANYATQIIYSPSEFQNRMVELWNLTLRSLGSERFETDPFGERPLRQVLERSWWDGRLGAIALVWEARRRELVRPRPFRSLLITGGTSARVGLERAVVVIRCFERPGQHRVEVVGPDQSRWAKDLGFQFVAGGLLVRPAEPDSRRVPTTTPADAPGSVIEWA